MSDIGGLQLGDIHKKKEAINKTGGINTSKSVFDTGSSEESKSESSNPYMSRVEELANRGPIMQNRYHVQNSNDIAFRGREKMSAPPKERVSEEKKVRSEESQQIIKAQPDLKVFSGDVMKKGTFTPEAKEAARHFFMQLTKWAGSFDDGGSGFYGEMGISSVLDCLYVDGMSLRNYVKEQFFYKTSGDPVQDKENMRNYVALLVARGEHVITLVRPNMKGDQADVEYRNLDVELSNVGAKEAARSRSLKEKSKQIRSDLKKRMDPEMTARTGAAFRNAKGISMDGFNRIEGAAEDLKGIKADDSPEYKNFTKNFDHYNDGLQKLGLKPGRDDINAAVAKKLKERCTSALEAADEFLRSNSKDKAAVAAVEKAKKELETDIKLLDDAINKKLTDEKKTMSLDEMLDSKGTDKPDNNNTNKPDNTDNTDNDNDEGDDGDTGDTPS